MRALRFLLPLVALLSAAPALADDVYLGTITSAGSSTTNLTTGTPFKLYAKTKVSIQCDAIAYVSEASADSGTGPTVTSSNGVKTLADGLFDIALGFNGTATTYAIAVISATGTVNCKVFQSL